MVLPLYSDHPRTCHLLVMEYGQGAITARLSKLVHRYIYIYIFTDAACCIHSSLVSFSRETTRTPSLLNPRLCGRYERDTNSISPSPHPLGHYGGGRRVVWGNLVSSLCDMML